MKKRKTKKIDFEYKSDYVYNPFGEEFTSDYPIGFTDFLPIIEKFVLTTPDFSQAVKKIVMLGNTGLEWKITGVSKRNEKLIQEEIQTFIDNQTGIINKLFRQIAITGALSAEAVPNLKMDGIEKIKIVPVKKIRFKNGIPYFIGFSGMIELNLLQYSFEAIETVENSPYPIPPFLSALRHVFIQNKSTDNIESIIEKFGMLGFIALAKKLPRRQPGESNNEYQTRLEKILRNLRDNFLMNRKNGLVVSYDDVEAKYTSATNNSQGFETVWRSNEEQIASGLDIDPALLGRSYSTTETYAGVVYSAFISKLKNFRHPIKRFLRKAVRLHLLMKGYTFDKLAPEWGEDESLHKEKDASVDKIKEETKQIKATYLDFLVQKGVIDLDIMAKELGYEKAVGKPQAQPKQIPEGLSLADFLFPSTTLPSTTLPSTTLRERMERVELVDKEQEAVDVADDMAKAEDILLKTYLAEAGKLADQVEKMAESGATEKEVFQLIEETMKKKIPETILDKLKPTVTGMLKKATMVGVEEAQKTATQQIPKIMDWFDDVGKFDFGNVFNDYSGDLNKVVKEALAGNNIPLSEVSKYMKTTLTDKALQNRYDLVVQNAVNKVRNFASVLSYEELGFDELEIVAIMDKKTSSICRNMNGRIIKVETAAKYVKEVLKTPADKVVSTYGWITDKKFEKIANSSTVDLMNNSSFKCKLPPFHGRCRTVVVLKSKTIVSKSTTINGNISGNTNDFKGLKKERFKEIEHLDAPERLNKINSEIATAKWEPDNLKAHDKKDYRHDFSEFGMDSKKMSDFILKKKNIDQLFTYKNNGVNNYALYNEKYNSVVIIDTQLNEILTCYKVDDINKYDKWIKIK